MRKILVVGADSKLARGYVSVMIQSNLVLTSRRENLRDCQFLNLADLATAESQIFDINYDLVVVFAALTNMAQCQQNKSLAMQINYHALVQLTDRINTKHWLLLSTNQVFDGSKPYVSKAQSVDPFNVYGETKALMEAYFLGRFPHNCAIVRLTKVITPDWNLFVNFRDIAVRGEDVEAFNNMNMAPVSLHQTVQFLSALSLDFCPGIFHLSGDKDVSYFEAVASFFSDCGLDINLVKPRPTSMVSPKFTSLWVDKEEQAFGFAAKSCRQVIKETLL